MKMPQCSVFGCTNKSGQQRNVGYYSFPNKEKYPNLHKKWTINTNRKDFIPTSNAMICGIHFREEDFNESDSLKIRLLSKEKFKFPRLKDGAFPTRNLGTEAKVSFGKRWSKIFKRKSVSGIFYEYGPSSSHEDPVNKCAGGSIQCAMGKESLKEFGSETCEKSNDSDRGPSNNEDDEEIISTEPVDGEAYDENAALGGPPQIVVPEENGDTDVENSSNIFTYIPEAQFQTSEQDRTFVPETSFETCEQFIKIENNGRKKSNIRLLDQRQLENSEQRICTAIEELKDISASVRSAEKEDEFDIFGRSIAEQLRQLPLTDALSIQLRLQTVVTEARLKATKTKARFENGVLDN